MGDQTTELTKEQHIKAIDAIISSVKFAMLTTITADGHLHACPMTTKQATLADGKIWFIGHKQTETVADIEKRHQVNVAYGSKDKDYVSINGTATLVNDQVKLDELWSELDGAFFAEGRDDPNVQLICVEINGAQYWQSPNALVGLFKMATAVISDGTSDMGKTHSVQF